MNRKQNHVNSAERLNTQYKVELQRYLARRLYRSRVEADDVIQETFLRLMRKDDLDLIDNPKAYLYRVAANVIYEMELKNQRHGELFEPEDEKKVESPTTGVDRIEHFSSLTAILRELPKMQRKVLLAIKYDGKTYQEIAKELNLSPDTVKKYAFLAVLHCRKRRWL